MKWVAIKRSKSQFSKTIFKKKICFQRHGVHVRPHQSALYEGRNITHFERIDLALNYLQFVEATRKGYTRAEMSQILETNLPMVHAAEALGGVRYKTHRMFEKRLRNPAVSG